VNAFLRCGDLQHGFARVRCADCQHEMFVAFSCKQRCTCPSCHQKRALLTAIHVAEDVCFPVAHRQVVFHVDQSVFLAAGDRAGIERLMQYMTRCPFSLSRLVKVTETGQVVYKAEKDACRAFPDPDSSQLARGPKRNYQILSPLDFLAEFTQHIPPKGAHLVRYYGWYSNKARGMRKKAAESAAKASGEPVAAQPTTSRASQTWAMLIKRVSEDDPPPPPPPGGAMKVIAFIEPPQGDVIEKILRGHRRAAMVGGLWDPASPPRPPPGGSVVVYVPDDDGDGDTALFDGPGELAFVPDPDWNRQPPTSDEPWEVTSDAYGDALDASF